MSTYDYFNKLSLVTKVKCLTDLSTTSEKGVSKLQIGSSSQDVSKNQTEITSLVTDIIRGCQKELEREHKACCESMQAANLTGLSDHLRCLKDFMLSNIAKKIFAAQKSPKNEEVYSSLDKEEKYVKERAEVLAEVMLKEVPQRSVESLKETIEQLERAVGGEYRTGPNLKELRKRVIFKAVQNLNPELQERVAACDAKQLEMLRNATFAYAKSHYLIKNILKGTTSKYTKNDIYKIQKKHLDLCELIRNSVTDQESREGFYQAIVDCSKVYLKIESFLDLLNALVKAGNGEIGREYGKCTAIMAKSGYYVTHYTNTIFEKAVELAPNEAARIISASLIFLTNEAKLTGTFPLNIREDDLLLLPDLLKNDPPWLKDLDRTHHIASFIFSLRLRHQHEEAEMLLKLSELLNNTQRSLLEEILQRVTAREIFEVRPFFESLLNLAQKQTENGKTIEQMMKAAKVVLYLNFLNICSNSAFTSAFRPINRILNCAKTNPQILCSLADLEEGIDLKNDVRARFEQMGKIELFDQLLAPWNDESFINEFQKGMVKHPTVFPLVIKFLKRLTLSSSEQTEDLLVLKQIKRFNERYGEMILDWHALAHSHPKVLEKILQFADLCPDNFVVAELTYFSRKDPQSALRFISYSLKHPDLIPLYRDSLFRSIYDKRVDPKRILLKLAGEINDASFSYIVRTPCF